MGQRFTSEKVKVSAGGIKIYSYENTAQNGFFISLFVKAGILYESDAQWGITHFLEHSLIRNLNFITDGALYRDLDRYGLELNASTFPEMVQFYISGAKEHYEIGAKYIAMLLSELKLSREDIDKERLRIKAEIRESDEKSSLGAHISRVAFAGTPLSRGIMGSCRTLDKIGAKQLEDYRREVFSPENIFFYLTGCIDEEKVDLLLGECEKYPLKNSALARTTYAPVPKDFGRRDGKIEVKNADFTMVRFQFDIDGDRVPYECCDLIYDILVSGYNSILFSELSEKRGICYDLTGGLDRYQNIGSLFFSFELRESMLEGAISLVCVLLNRLKRELLDEGECMKSAYVEGAGLLYDDSRELNFTLAQDNHILNRAYTTLDMRIERYKGVTPEDIKRACAEIFKVENLTLGIKGKRTKIDTDVISEIVKNNL